MYFKMVFSNVTKKSKNIFTANIEINGKVYFGKFFHNMETVFLDTKKSKIGFSGIWVKDIENNLEILVDAKALVEVK